MAKHLKDEERRFWRDAMRGVKPLAMLTTHRPPKGDQIETVSSPRKRGPRSDDATLTLDSRVRADDESKHSRTAPSIDRRTLKSLKRGEMPVEARLDLHGLTQAAAHRALVRFIAEVAADGVRLALVITGKGRGGEGVLREAVPRWLGEAGTRAQILAVTPAPPQLGGGGALCVLLRRRRERTARS